MRNRLPPLVFSALALVVVGMAAPVCLAQAQDDPQAAEAEIRDAPRKSAFGRVMAVMIEALQQEALRDGDPGMRQVRTTTAGTPLGIKVGGSFMLDQGRLGQDELDPREQQRARP